MRKIERLQAGRTGKRLDSWRSTNRLHRNWDLFSPDQSIDSPIASLKKANDFKSSPDSPLSPIGQTCAAETHEPVSSIHARTRPADCLLSLTRTDHESVWTDWTVWTEPEKTVGYTSPHPQGLQDCLDWTALDGWYRRLGANAGIAHRRAVVADWAKAAGGAVDGDVITLPLGLRRCLSLAELKTQARIAGLKVVERTLACVWCPNSAIPGDTLCEHCRWLAGGWA